MLDLSLLAISMVQCVVSVGLASSDMYMKMAKEQEMERQSRRSKKLAKQRTSKSGKRRRHGAAAAADDDQDDDIPIAHVVSTAIDAPEVAWRANKAGLECPSLCPSVCLSVGPFTKTSFDFNSFCVT